MKRAAVIIRAPRVTISLHGDGHAWRIYRAFEARHSRWRVTRSKRWGVALIALPASFEDYLSGSSMKLLRQKRRLAESHGLRYAYVSSQDHLDDILEVNLSAPLRQGRALPVYYLDPEVIADTYRDRRHIHAILDEQRRLRAYAWAPVVGEAIVIETLLGHADDLEAGIMYLLISEVIRHAIEQRTDSGIPQWAMYDTFWGASTGLAYFKARLGFKPYTVAWKWSGPRPNRGSRVT